MLAKLSETRQALGTRPLLHRVLRDAIKKFIRSGDAGYHARPYELPNGGEQQIDSTTKCDWVETTMAGTIQRRMERHTRQLLCSETKGKVGEKEKMTGQRWQVAVIGTLWDQ